MSDNNNNDNNKDNNINNNNNDNNSEQTQNDSNLTNSNNQNLEQTGQQSTEQSNNNSNPNQEKNSNQGVGKNNQNLEQTEQTQEQEQEHNHGKIDQVDLEKQMRKAYLDYAMSVIVGRALPDIKDGLKPVHRRVVYAMYSGGFRPNSGYFKSARVVGEVMGNFHPHGDSAIYDTLVRMAQDWSLRYPLVDGQGNFGSPGNDGAAAPRYTECKMSKLAMELVRDIDKDTVDFVDNYDGRTQEPSVLPARFPNLLVNGSSGIAVGMATNIPPHNLQEVADGVKWHLDNPQASNEELLDALLGIIKGPDFPTGATIVGNKGIIEAYKTGRGSVIMRAKVDIEQIKGTTCLVVKELPYQVNPDELGSKIAELAKDGVIAGISAMRDETSGRTGQRLVIVLKKDAVPMVVLNNLYKHTSLQRSFGANMVCLVNGVPRTVRLDGFIRYWTAHQIEVIVRRTKYLLKEAQGRAHILRGLLKALDKIDQVVELIRNSPNADDAKEGLQKLLEIDQIQATAILDLQLRRLAALERQKILDEAKELEEKIADLNDILSSQDRQRNIVQTELSEVVSKYADDRRTQIVPDEDSLDAEAYIKNEPVVITITKDGFAKRTQIDEYRVQNRGGKGTIGTTLRTDDLVEHFFVANTHDWLLCFTNFGNVYRVKAYKVPESARTAKGKHIANIVSLLPNEQVKQVLDIKNFTDHQYLVLATKKGQVKKSLLEDYNTVLKAKGLRAISLYDGDELVSAQVANEDSHIVMISKFGKAIHVQANDKTFRPMGRTGHGVRGIKITNEQDYLLSMQVILKENLENASVFTVTQEGFAKKTLVNEYTIHGRGGQGMKVANLPEARGKLAGALITYSNEEVLVIMEQGNVVRSSVDQVRHTSRSTSGVRFAKPSDGDQILLIAKNLTSNKGVSDNVEKNDIIANDSEN